MAKKKSVVTRSGTPKQVYLSKDEWELIETASKILDRGNMSALIIRGAVLEAKRVIREEGSK